MELTKALSRVWLYGEKTSTYPFNLRLLFARERSCNKRVILGLKGGGLVIKRGEERKRLNGMGRDASSTGVSCYLVFREVAKNGVEYE